MIKTIIYALSIVFLSTIYVNDAISQQRQQNTQQQQRVEPVPIRVWNNTTNLKNLCVFGPGFPLTMVPPAKAEPQQAVGETNFFRVRLDCSTDKYLVTVYTTKEKQKAVGTLNPKIGNHVYHVQVAPYFVGGTYVLFYVSEDGP